MADLISAATEITPDLIRQQLEEIGKRDSATRTDQPSSDANSAASVVTPAADVAPAATPQAHTAPSTADAEWWNGADVSHTMLRSAKSADVETMFKNAQRKIREQGEKLRRLESAATPAPPPPTPAPPQSTAQNVDPREAEYELVQYTDAARARQIVREWAREEAQATTAQQRESEVTQQRVASVVTAARAGTAAIVSAYGIDETTAGRRVLAAILPQLNDFAERAFAEAGGDPNDPAQADAANEFHRQILQDPENYRLAYADIYGEPASAASAPTITVPAVPQRGTPPHTTAPAPASPAPKVVRQPTLDPSRDRELSMLAAIGNFDEDQTNDFKRRVASAK